MILTRLADQIGTHPFTRPLQPPPAPVVNGIQVTYNSTNDGKQVHSRFWSGLIDTGSYLTIIPESILDEWSVNNTGEESCTGFNGISQTIQAIYEVELKLPGLPLISLPKVGITKRNYILLGRDSLQGMLLAIDTQSSRWAMRPVPSTIEALQFMFWRFQPLRS